MNPSALIWRADLAQAAPSAGLRPAALDATASNADTTGWAALDAEVCTGGGWPRAGLTELLAPWPQDPTWLLLAPWLARAVADGWPMVQPLVRPIVRPIVCVNPPAEPYLPGLHALGVVPQALLRITTSSQADAAWAVEQALQAQACLTVLWWTQDLSPSLGSLLRRLHLAAQEGATPLFAVRPQAAASLASPAPLRLAVGFGEAAGLSVRITKRRGPAMEAPLTLPTALQRRCPLAGHASQAPARSSDRPSPSRHHPTQPHAVARPAPAGLVA